MQLRTTHGVAVVLGGRDVGRGSPCVLQEGGRCVGSDEGEGFLGSGTWLVSGRMETEGEKKKIRMSRAV